MMAMMAAVNPFGRKRYNTSLPCVRVATRSLFQPQRAWCWCCRWTERHRTAERALYEQTPNVRVAGRTSVSVHDFLRFHPSKAHLVLLRSVLVHELLRFHHVCMGDHVLWVRVGSQFLRFIMNVWEITLSVRAFRENNSVHYTHLFFRISLSN